MPFVHRPIVMSDAGIVVSGHHRASEAGAAILRQGGNAIDAAVATSAALAVAVPHMNGLGGDAFALFYDAQEGKVTAINASGRAPGKATVERYRGLGHTKIPQRGPLSISVPGLVAAWGDCLDHWGTRTLGEVLDASISLAEEGVPLDQTQIDFLTGPTYALLTTEFPALIDHFGAPRQSRPLGARLKQPILGETLRKLVTEGVACFYHGQIAKALLSDLVDVGALVSAEDLGTHATEFAEPLEAGYRGRRVYAAPPNSQGIALTSLLALEETLRASEDDASSAGSDLDPVWYMHAKQTAFGIRDRFAADPARDNLSITQLSLADLLKADDVSRPQSLPARSGGGDTSTFVVVDSAGNAVSWVQSLFEEFGSCVVSKQTGIVLHNRLHLERLDDHPVRGLRPRMRPFHTLSPALVVDDGRCDMAIATPGDHGQPQSIYQVLRHVYAGGVAIQDAIERPRLRHDEGNVVMFEDRAPEVWLQSLEAEGYEPRSVGSWSRLMGGVNAVQRLCGGVWGAGADPRRSCYAVSAG